jgi:hypothetical protein
MIPEFKAFLCDVKKSPYDYDRANPEAKKGLGKEVV